MLSIDPFANTSKLAKITNDLNHDYDTDYHLDATDFLKTFESNSVDFIFYDPPYSLRQVSEVYKSVGIEVTMETTQSSWRTKHINEISNRLGTQRSYKPVVRTVINEKQKPIFFIR